MFLLYFLPGWHAFQNAAVVMDRGERGEGGVIEAYNFAAVKTLTEP